MKETDIEAYLRDKVKAIGGKAFKFVSPGNRGVPDRHICLPGGICVYVETKAPGKKSTPQQLKQQRFLVGLGFKVFSDIDSKQKVDDVINYCKRLVKI